VHTRIQTSLGGAAGGIRAATPAIPHVVPVATDPVTKLDDAIVTHVVDTGVSDNANKKQTTMEWDVVECDLEVAARARS